MYPIQSFSKNPLSGNSHQILFFSLCQNDSNYHLSYYFISFGNLDVFTQKINDKAISNNSDMVKVIFTLAKIILAFGKNEFVNLRNPNTPTNPPPTPILISITDHHNSSPHFPFISVHKTLVPKCPIPTLYSNLAATKL
jgi:hypothetical protein